MFQTQDPLDRGCDGFEPSERTHPGIFGYTDVCHTNRVIHLCIVFGRNKFAYLSYSIA